MKSQVAKRININLTEKNLKGIKDLQKWYKMQTGEELKQSDIVRNAIDRYTAEINCLLKTFGKNHAILALENEELSVYLDPENKKDYVIVGDEDKLPF